MRTTRVPGPDEYWTPEDARLLLEEWRRGGGPLAAFARRRGIAAHRLYWWRARLASSTTQSLSLIPASIVGADELVSSTAPITIRLPNGVAIEFANASPNLVASIVSELSRTRL